MSAPVCKHCGQPIRYTSYTHPGYWIHTNGIISCSYYTHAEPFIEPPPPAAGLRCPDTLNGAQCVYAVGHTHQCMTAAGTRFPNSPKETTMSDTTQNCAHCNLPMRWSYGEATWVHFVNGAVECPSTQWSPTPVLGCTVCLRTARFDHASAVWVHSDDDTRLCDPAPTEWRGHIDSFGGGKFTVMVDRDTMQYPPEGLRVVVTAVPTTTTADVGCKHCGKAIGQSEIEPKAWFHAGSGYRVCHPDAPSGYESPNAEPR